MSEWSLRRTVRLVLLAFSIAATRSSAQQPPSPADLLAQLKVEQKTLLAELTSGDQARIDKAVQVICERETHLYNSRGSLLMLLVQAKLYDRADEITKQYITDHPDSLTVSKVQAVRVQSLVQQQKWPDALAAARSYYDSCALEDTSKAIALINTCLLGVHPDDVDLVRRFKQQQVASANTAIPDAAPADPALGEPIMPTIKPDTKTFAEAADAMETGSAQAAAFKGNLMLLSGRADEAKKLFEQAEAVAQTADDTKDALQGQARALRAKYGSIGPANAFILKLKKHH